LNLAGNPIAGYFATYKTGFFDEIHALLLNNCRPFANLPKPSFRCSGILVRRFSL